MPLRALFLVQEKIHLVRGIIGFSVFYFFSFLAQLHEVHRLIVVASAIGVPIPVTINVTIPIPILKVFY